MTGSILTKICVLGSAVVVAGLAIGQARAQDSPVWPDLSTWQVGGMVFVAPKYEGSKSYEVIGFPLIIPGGLDDTGRVSVKGVDDFRFRLLNSYGFEAGPIAGWRFGRDEDDADRLIGLGDVDGGLVVGGYAGYRAGPVFAGLSYGHQVTGDDAGGLLRFGVDVTGRPVDRVKVTAGVGATWADDDYMQSYFGVTALQAQRSGLAAFDADAGIKDVNLTLQADVMLDPRWTLKLMGRYAHLLGDAADSPVSETSDQFYGGVGLTYRFDTRSFAGR